MQIEHFLSFIGLSALVIATPGPNAALVITTAVSRGMRAGLLAVCGILSAQTLQLVIVGLGLIWLVDKHPGFFDPLRYVGAGYLVFLGIQTWRSAAHPLEGRAGDRKTIRQAALVGILNPETFTLAVTFFPQFMNSSAPAGPQYWILMATFTMLGIVLNSAQAVLGSLGHRMAKSERSQMWVGRISGVVLIVAGVFLAEVHVA
ncbi:MAG: LysE family translocator [Pseudomonadota bacterium]